MMPLIWKRSSMRIGARAVWNVVTRCLRRLIRSPLACSRAKPSCSAFHQLSIASSTAASAWTTPGFVSMISLSCRLEVIVPAKLR
ncbi:Uncharacterised protein [Mycobacteroides abscessus subsp. abscessus]|nr:Uncharacterised protein [Mycobacteroides abscessus subsp. abscessus]